MNESKLTRGKSIPGRERAGVRDAMCLVCLRGSKQGRLILPRVAKSREVGEEVRETDSQIMPGLGLLAFPWNGKGNHRRILGRVSYNLIFVLIGHGLL